MSCAAASRGSNPQAASLATATAPRPARASVPLSLPSRPPAVLVQVEILLQTTKSADKKLVETVFKILYATEDDFEAPPEGQAAATGAGTEAQAPAEEHAVLTTTEGEAAPGHRPQDSFGTVEPGEDGELVDAEEI